MARSTLLHSLIALSCLGASSAARLGRAPAKVPLIVFGDSQLDTGNNNYLNTTYNTNFPPYGINYIPSSGRASDGKLVTDFVSDYLGVPSPPPFLSKPPSLALGVNFASGGAGVLNSTSFRPPAIAASLSQQLGAFQSLVAGGNISRKDVSRAIYLINIGANDIFFAPTDQLQAALYVGSMVQGFISFMRALYRTGARKFIVSNCAPVGCAPSTRAIFGQNGTNPSCVDGPNTLSSLYNGAVATALKGLEFVGNKVPGGAKTQVVIFNQYQLALDLFNRNSAADPSSLNACCGAPPPINGLVQCGRSATFNNVTLTATLCKSIDKQVFWDYVHPTQLQNQALSVALWNGGAYTEPKGGAKVLLGF